MNDRRREPEDMRQPLDSGTCRAKEISESMAQTFAGIYYLLEAGDAVEAGGTRGFPQIAKAKEAAREGIREAMRLRTCGSSSCGQRNIDQAGAGKKSRRT